MPSTTILREEDRSHLARFGIRVGGAPAPLRAMEDLLDCTVENSLHLPDMCTIRLADSGLHWVDSGTFAPGKEVQVSGGGEKGALTPIFWGEVTALEMDLAAHGMPTLVVRCMSRAHRLHRGRFARSFVQMTDSDIVKKVGAEAGFTVKADSTPQVHDWAFQNNQTNWEFLSERAARNGCRLYVRGPRELVFARVSDGEARETVKLTWGADLRSFRPRLSAAPQVTEVVVRGWDPKTKRSIVGRASPKPVGIPQVGGGGADGAAAAQKAYGAARMVVVDRPVTTQAEAEAMAKSLRDEIGGEYLEAEGLCYGQPKLLPGVAVQVDRVGSRFTGRYFVTSTTHSYTPAEGYTTQFAVSGKRPHTVLSLLDGGGEGAWEAGRTGPAHAPMGGNIVVAVVTDNKDPQNQGRVKVKYPWLTEEHTSFWARIASPMAGPDRGFFFLPEIDDEVLVAFEHGDIHRPYLLGALWNGKDKPVEPNSKAVQGAKVERRTIKTRIGHTLLFDDTGGKGEVMVKTCNGHVLTLNDAKKKIEAKTTSGHTVTLDDAGKKIVVVDQTGKNKITIQSTDNSMKLECFGNFTVDAKGKVAIKGQAGIDMQTPAQVKVEGQAGINMKTPAQFSAEGTAGATVKGAMLNLEGQAQATLKAGAMVTVQGAMVKIN